MLRVIAECRPRFVLAENVRGAINLALDTVYSGLVGKGYKVWPYVIPASAVGAPHQRERLFVVGVREDVADAYAERLEGRECANLQECPGEQLAREGGALWPTPSVHGNYNRKGLSENSGDGLATAVKLWPTPCANDDNKSPEAHMAMKRRMGRNTITSLQVRIKQEHNGGQLNPEWVEILMGFPIGWTSIDDAVTGQWPGWPALMGEDQHPYEPPRTVTKCADRAKRLKCLGNAVVPQQAFAFFLGIAEMEGL